MMYLLQIFNWINDKTSEIADIILEPINSMPGTLKFLIILAITFLSLIGLIRVATKALKTVVGVSIAFLIVLIIWLVFIK